MCGVDGGQVRLISLQADLVSGLIAQLLVGLFGGGLQATAFTSQPACALKNDLSCFFYMLGLQRKESFAGYWANRTQSPVLIYFLPSFLC